MRWVDPSENEERIKMKIVVLAGGTSTEREVSIVSGTNVCEALRSKGHQAVLLDVFFGEDELTENYFGETYDVQAAAEKIKSRNPMLEERQKTQRSFFGPHVIEICQQADVVFLALHGENGENGKVQAAFDLLGIRYTGTDYLSSALAMDKNRTKQMFSLAGVPAPKGICIRRGDCTDLQTYQMELPVVVKTCCGGSSVGVYIAHTEQEYKDAVEAAFSYEEEIIVEEYIRGREFSIGVVDGTAYPIIEIAPLEGFYDYKNKYQPGATVETCPAQISKEKTEEMQRYAEKGAEALGITGYCRLDFMMREDGAIYCLEANTLPGMTPTSLLPQEAAVLGMDYPALCEKLIEISLKLR